MSPNHIGGQVHMAKRVLAITSETPESREMRTFASELRKRLD